jgi:hypothetical protein
VIVHDGQGLLDLSFQFRIQRRSPNPCDNRSSIEKASHNSRTGGSFKNTH